MILSMAYLKGLIKQGEARYTGGTEEESIVEHDGKRFVAVDRLDLQRVDHYEIS